MKNIRTLHLFLIILFLLLASSFVHIGGYTTPVGNNGGKYLIAAQQILNMDKVSKVEFYHARFVYPLVLVASFLIGGIGITSAHWATQIIFVLSILSVFFFAYMIYGRWVAFFSSLSLCITPTMFFMGRGINLDFLLTALLLLSCLLFIKGCLSSKQWIFGLAGLAMGLACFTKETALFYLSFPFIVILLAKDVRNKYVLKGTIIYYGCFFVIMLISALYLEWSGESLWQLVGAMQPGGMDRVKADVPFWVFYLEMTVKGPLGLGKVLSQTFKLFPLMAIGWFIVLWKGLIKKQKGDAILISVVIPALPFALMLGLYYPWINERHIVLFVFLSYVVLFRMVQILSGTGRVRELVLKKLNSLSDVAKKSKGHLLWRAIVVVLLVIATTTAAARIPFVRQKMDAVKEKVRFGVHVEPGGRFREEIASIAEWIETHIPPEAVLCTGGYYDHAIMFYTNFDYSYRVYGCQPKSYQIPDLIKQKDESSEAVRNDRIVGIGASRKFRSHLFQYRSLIYVLLESDVRSFIENLYTEKQWIMIFKTDNPDFDFVYNILTEHTRLAFDNDEVSIFETLPRESFEVSDIEGVQWIGNAKEDLKWLRENYPTEYEQYINFLDGNKW